MSSGIALAAQSQIVLDDYNNGISEKWQTKKFVGQTEYTLATIDGVQCINAKSQGAASGLIYKIKYDPQDYPFITWQWRVDHILDKGDATKKSGDDFAARVYIIFPSFLFWQTRVVNYIWANKIPKGTIQPSTYTGNAAMIAVESGSGKTGQWITEKRNIIDDYTKAFGKPPGEIGAVSIMTDTDNTGESATACYGQIIITK